MPMFDGPDGELSDEELAEMEEIECEEYYAQHPEDCTCGEH